MKEKMSKEDLYRKLQLTGINIDRWYLYDIRDGKVIIKDFELIVIAKILDIDLNDLKKLINFKKINLKTPFI